MTSYYELLKEIPQEHWDYYSVINPNATLKNPFTSNSNYNEFIYRYFQRGGKKRVFDNDDIITDELRLPNHICSVFFMGILIYYKTAFHKKYPLSTNEPGYSTFPFIWFLIALFHDNAYQMEDINKLRHINNIENLIIHFNIEHNLFESEVKKCKKLLNSRRKYFSFRKKKYGVVDHGILGGLLLYDRLVKIRKLKKSQNKENLFWGIKLVNQYKLAANAISIHNIWVQSKEICKEFNLNELENFAPVKFKDFPLFYILGIVDTIEPLKLFNRNGNFDDKYVLENIKYEFSSNSMEISVNENSNLEFDKYIKQVKYLEGWLDIEVIIEDKLIALKFK